MPTLDDLVVKEICGVGPRLLTMTGFLRQILIFHFSDASRIELAELKSRLYSETPPTGILIVDASVWSPVEAGKRPSITIQRGEWKNTKLSIARQLGEGSSLSQRCVDQWQGAHIISAISREGAEAELVASEAINFLHYESPYIRQRLGLQSFHVAQIQGMKAAAPQEFMVVQFAVVYDWVDQWQLQRI